MASSTSTRPPALPRSSSASAAQHRQPWSVPSGRHSRPTAASFPSARDRRSSAGSTAAVSMDMDSDDHRSESMQHSSQAHNSRVVALNDRRLATIANETAAMIHWDRILRAPEPRLARWKWAESCGDFSLYTRHEAQRFAVLAIGVVDASVAELATLLQARGNEQHVQRMEALYGEQFKHGSHVHDVDLRNDALPPLTAGETDSVLSQLSVKTATFTKPHMLSSHEQWCYVDAVYSHQSSQIFEKHMTTLRARDVLSGKSGSKAKEFHDVISGYCVQPDLTDASCSDAKTSSSSRVHFYAELFTPKQFGFSVPTSMSALTERAIRHRLVRLAQTCSRLPQLVRRRRLGVRVLVDNNCIFPPTKVPCVSCDKHLMIAKLCRMCGQGVCDDCSSKYERERQVRGSDRIRIESIRVCELCIRRLDTADYAHLGDAAFAPAHVRPDPDHAKPASAALSSMLQDALMNATTAEHKASVMNVIKCVLDQEADSLSAKTDSSVGSAPVTPQKRVLLTVSSSEKDYVRALVDLEVDKVPYTEAAVAEANGRTYAVDPTTAVDIQMMNPVPEDEEARLKVIQKTHIRELGRSQELSLICEMASREMGCFATLVTIVDKEELYVAASNVKTLELQSFARNDSFCAHTIMSQNPLVVPHPEADVRFHQSLPVKMLGTKYYCGFPMVAGDAIIGAMCCVDVKSRELTESQYTYLTKLADTAGKLVSLHAAQKTHSLSSEEEPLPESEK